jgi:small subunit ribosomal protein S4
MRLDNIVYRAGFAPTVPAARQLVNHRHIKVNEHIVDIPSYRCRVKDAIELRNYLSDVQDAGNISSINRSIKMPYHLQRADGIASIKTMIDRRSVALKVNELLIVEYYSRQA